MGPDGSHPYRLTTNSDRTTALRTSETGVPYDNFHAYWSPNGRHVIWTRTEANPLAEGGQTWSIMLGDFGVKNGRPALETSVPSGKGLMARIETQPCSLDGKGFLFFVSGGYMSPYQATPPGWGNAASTTCGSTAKGRRPAHPRVTLIGDNAPLYQEQAIFTPDMRTVIMMSNRAATLGSWYTAVASAAQRTRFDAPDTGSTQTLQFLADFNGPDFRADLFAVDVRTRAIRRLTYINRVIPEFYWNDDYTKIIWGLGGDRTALSYVGRFRGITRAQRRVPRVTPLALRASRSRCRELGLRRSRFAIRGRPTTSPSPFHPRATRRQPSHTPSRAPTRPRSRR